MAKRDANHSTGDLAATLTKLSFEEEGYAVNDVLKDYGEDFFVVTHDKQSGIVEPARIFIQSKGTNRAGDWTEYVDPLTVRNWVTGNELVVVVKRNLVTGEVRYCIPEFDYSYFDVAGYIFDNNKLVPIRCATKYNKDTPDQLIWAARIRHYERMALLYLPDDVKVMEIPAVRLVGWEFLARCGLIETEGFVPSAASLSRLASWGVEKDQLEDQDNFTIREQVLYRNWLIIVYNRLKELSPCITLKGSFLEHLAIVMQLAGFNYGLNDDGFDFKDLDPELHFLWKS